MLTSVLQTIGNTPLLRLDLSRDLPGTVWLKLENRNPGGSIKDRVAFHLIENALQWGELEPGGLVVEGTSGNMGIGIALVSAVRGLRCVLAMPESMSIERRNLLKGLGAELVLTPAAKGMTGAVDEARRIAEEQSGFIPGQFTNPEAVQAHYKTTGPEIYSDSVGKMDVLVAGVGSGSSITGAGRFLKERIPGFKVIAVEPEASPVLSGGKASPHLIQGIGAGFIPKNYDASVVDEVLQVSNDNAILTARQLAQEEGLLVGISSGAATYAATILAQRPENKGKVIVTLLPDTGERYLSTLLYAFEEYPL